MGRIDPQILKRNVQTLLKSSGANPEVASQVAESLVGSDLRGHETHGVFRLPLYIEGIEKIDWINPNAVPTIQQETAISGVVDGRSTFGQVVGRFGLQVAIEKAEKEGIGVVGIKNATHLGRIGEWAEIAAKAGYLSIIHVASQGGTATVAPAGSTDRLYSTNPIAFGVPTYEALDFPIILDISTSQVSHGKIRTLSKKDESMPGNWAISKDGEDVTNPRAFEEEGVGAILPLGGRTAGYKGYGLAVVTELFASIIGDGYCAGQQHLKRSQNIASCIVIEPTKFTSQSDIEERIKAFSELIRSAEYSSDIPNGHGARGDGGLLPGEPEYQCLLDRRESGIPLNQHTIDSLRQLAEMHEVDGLKGI